MLKGSDAGYTELFKVLTSSRKSNKPIVESSNHKSIRLVKDDPTVFNINDEHMKITCDCCCSEVDQVVEFPTGGDPFCVWICLDCIHTAVKVISKGEIQ
jgi:hypothetical protein